ASNLATTTKVLVSAMNAWNLSVQDAQRFTESFFLAVKNGNVSAEELANALGNIASMASQAGISFQEILAAIATLTRQGMSAEMAVRGLTQIISQVISPSESVAAAARQLGVEFNASALQAKGLAGFLQEITAAAQGNVDILSQLFGSTQSLRAALGLVGNNAKQFSSILNEMQNSAGAVAEAANKMGQSWQSQFQRLQNLLNALKLEFGKAMTPIVQAVADAIEKFTRWVETMSPVEKVILAISAALVALIPVVKTATFVFGIFQAMAGNWVGALAGLGAIIGSLTVAFGMLRQKVEDTNATFTETAEAFEKIERVSIDSLVSKTDALSQNIENSRKRAEELVEASQKLVRLVADYNYAQETGLGNVKEIKKAIDELLNQYPQLAGAVGFVNEKYIFQKEKLQEIINLEIKRVEIAIEQAQLELQALKAQEQFLRQQEEMYRRLLSDAQRRIEATQKLVQKYKEIINTTQDLAKKEVAESMLDAFTKAHETAKQQAAEYSQKLAEILGVQARMLALEQQLTQLRQARQKLEEAKKISPEQVVPTYEQKLRKINELISQQEERLKAYVEKSIDAYEADLELLRMYIAQKVNLLQQSANYLVEQGESAKKVLPLLEQIQQLQKKYEQYKPKKEEKLIDLAEIDKNIKALREMQIDKNREVAEQIYRSVRSRVVNALARAYIEGNQELIAKLEQYFTTIEEIGKLFEKPTRTKTEELREQYEEAARLTERARKALQEQNIELAATIYKDLSNKLAQAAREAYIQGADEIYAQFTELQKQAEREIGNIIQASRTREQFLTQYQELQNLYARLADALATGNMDLAEKLYSDLMRTLSQEALKAFQAGENEIYLAYEQFYKKVKAEFEKIFKESISVEELEDKIEKIKQALYEGREDIAEKLRSDVIRQASRAAFEAFLVGDQELLRAFEEILKRTQTIFERHARYTQAAARGEELFERKAQDGSRVLEQKDEALEKLQKRYRDYEINLEILAKKEAAAGAEIEKKIQLYQEIAELYKKLGVDTAEYTKKIEQLQQKLKQPVETEQLDRYVEVMRELATEAARQAQERRYAGYNEMVQIQQLRVIAQDANRAYEERIEALKRILELQKAIGEAEELQADTKKQIEELTKAIQEAERLRTEQLQQQKELLNKQASFLNSILSSIANAISKFGEMGELVATILKSISFEVKEVYENGELIGYTLVNPFRDIEQLTARIGENLARWGIEQIANTLSRVVDDLKELTKEYSKSENKTRTSFSELLKNYNEFEANLAKKRMLEATQLGARIGSSAVGALIGFFLGGPIGAIIGAGIGGAIGNGIASTLDEQIKQLDEKLQVTWQKIKEALGTDIDSIATALQRAFSAETYEEFINNFSKSLEEMTKEALIKAFLASEYMQPLLSRLSDTISAAVLDGILTAEEIAKIQQAGQDVLNAAKPFFDVLKQLFSSSRYESVEWKPATSLHTVTEETANRLVALLTTLTTYAAQMKAAIVDGARAVKVVVVNPSEAGTLRALGVI
ncbi:MAG: phage tail tape measure protein, partial [Archaeoglobaceae archaeon]